MGKYQIMTLDVRCHIYALMQEGKSQAEIARRVGFHKSSISREIAKFSKGKSGPYDPTLAHKRATRRLSQRGRNIFIDEKLHSEISKKMDKGWSPEQITGRFRLEGKKICSVQTIYNYIHRNYRTPLNLYSKLRRYNKRGSSQYRGKTMKFHNPNTKPIAKRPKVVEKRSRIGDWERDSMHIANGNILLVLTERKSRLTRVEDVGKPAHKKIINSTAAIFSDLKHRPMSVTQDNGPEFRGLPKEDFKRYNCVPRRPDQRGSVENSIGLLRQYITRKEQIKNLTKRRLKKIENLINNRPRKVLGYRTPKEVFAQGVVALNS